MVKLTSSPVPTPARNAAITSGTLLVDQATPDDHVPRETGLDPTEAIAMPTSAERRLDNS
jgi:hypothetical protein